MNKNKPLMLRIAESSSPLGAAILGLGIGVWLSADLSQFKWLLIITGGILHLSGMIIMNQHDKKLEELSPFWKTLFQSLFWICLIFLVFIFIYIIWMKLS